jgi:hypothetical protein
MKLLEAFNITRLTLLAGAVLALSTAVQADTIANGNFSAGNSGFSSDYTASSVCSTAAPFTADFYFVGTDPGACNGGWETMSDPTNAGLNMLIVNGATDGTSQVWDETLSTSPNTAYAFTFWLADVDLSVYNTAPETLEFLVNGSVVPGCSGYSPATPSQWVEETCNYTSGPGSTETLALIDTETAFESNDFALDDISDPATNSAVPEPGSLGLLSLVLAGLVALRRRRQMV